MIAVGIAAFLIQIFQSIRNREALADVTGDPWNGRTLEWATSSPPPEYNFAFTPIVHDLDAYTDMKARGMQRPMKGFKPIHMPKNTGAGIILAGISVVFGFAMIWYIWWLAIVAFVALIGTAIAHTFDYDRGYTIPADKVSATETAYAAAISQRG